PTITAPDTIFTCHIPQAVDLLTLGTFTFAPTPPGATRSCSGPGITDPQNCLFVSPGTGTYQILLHYTIPPGCDTTLAFWVKVSDLVSAQAGPNVQVCQSQNFYTLQGTPATGHWNPAPGLNPQTGVLDLNLAGPGLHIYNFVIGQNTPCVSSDAVTVTIVPGGVDAGPAIYACETAGQIQLPTGLPATGTFTGPQLTGGNMVNIAALVPGDYTYLYTLTTLPEACNHDTLTLHVAPLPDPGFSIDPDTGCVGVAVNFLALEPNADNYHWTFGGGGTDDGAAVSHAFGVEGDFSVMLTVTTNTPAGALLCSTNSSQNIHIVQPPQSVGFGKDQAQGCGPLTVQFTNTSVAEDAQYFWDFGNQDASTQYQPGPATYLAGLEDTLYVVKMLLVTRCDTFLALDTIRVLSNPHANFGITYDEPCSGGLLQINNTSTGHPATSTWFIGTAPALLAFNPPAQTFFTDSLPRIVHITLVDSNQCATDTFSRDITVNPTDVVALAHLSDTSALCAGHTLTLTSYSTPGAPVHWLTPFGNFNGDSINVTFPNPGTYPVFLYVEGCGFDSMSVPITVLPLPTLAVTPDPVFCPHHPATFTVTTTGSGSLLWFGDGDSTFLQQAAHIYALAGNYPLHAESVSPEGCRATWDGQLTVQAA
ncbi:MAG: PKD domain-containing protein, partial [Saprospiraceae bacterium]